MLPKVCVLFILMNVKLIVCEPVPQLDLPPLDVTITAKPEVTLNSYTEDKGSDRSEAFSSDYDRDRSQRFGPPYAYNNQFENRSATGGFEDINYNRNKPFLDDDKYYADRNRDDFNGNFDRDRYRNNNYRDGYQYQRVLISSVSSVIQFIVDIGNFAAKSERKQRRSILQQWVSTRRTLQVRTRTAISNRRRTPSAYFSRNRSKKLVGMFT